MSLVRVLTRPHVASLGEYPGYYCYDAARPSILPYWLDDFTESACKYNIKNIVADITSCVAGSPDCGAPPNPNPAVSGPGAGGPPLASGNSTASADPIQTLTIPQAVGQAAGETFGEAVSGAATGLKTGLGDLTTPFLILGGIVGLGVVFALVNK